MAKDTLKKAVGAATGGPLGYMQADAQVKQDKAMKRAQKEQAAALKEKRQAAQAERTSLIDQTRSQMGLDGTDYSLKRTGTKAGVKTLTGQLG